MENTTQNPHSCAHTGAAGTLLLTPEKLFCALGIPNAGVVFELVLSSVNTPNHFLNPCKISIASLLCNRQQLNYKFCKRVFPHLLW